MDKPWKFTAVRAGMAALTLIYLPFVLSDAGAPEWSAPWRPSAGGAGVLAFTIVVTLALWADGWLLQAWLSGRKSRSARAATAHKFESSAFGWFFIRAALLDGGAPAGAGLSFGTHDSRYAIIFAVLSALMILLLPRPKTPDASGFES